MNEKESLWKDFEQRATVTFPEIKGATVSVLEGIAKDAGFTYKEIGKLQTIFEEKKAQGMAFYSILFSSPSILFYSIYPIPMVQQSLLPSIQQVLLFHRFGTVSTYNNFVFLSSSTHHYRRCPCQLGKKDRE